MTAALLGSQPVEPFGAPTLRAIFAFEVPFVVVSVLLATSAASGWPLVLMLVTGAVVFAGHRPRWFRAIAYLISWASALIVVLAPNLTEWSLSLWAVPSLWALSLTVLTILARRNRT